MLFYCRMWEAPTNSKGSQIYVPVGLELSGQISDSFGVQLMLRSGYVRSRQSSGGVTGVSSGATDTSVGTSFSYSGWDGIQPYISFSTNLPTGNAQLSVANNSAHMDSDVVATPTFGEGFNGGTTIGANIPLSDSVIASLGFGYTYRGAYDTSNLGKFNPGDSYTVNLGLGYQGDRLTVQSQLSYSGEETSTRNGAGYYKSGGIISTVLGLAYAWTDNIASRSNLSFTHSEKNKILVGGLPPLVSEAFNSNSNVFQIDIDTTYSGANFSIGPTAGFLHRDRNSWSPTDLEFLPAKRKWSVGLTGQYALSQSAALSAQASRIWVKQNESPDKTILGPGSGIPGIKTDAWLFSVGLNWQL